jgi:hypothetical protein
VLYIKDSLKKNIGNMGKPAKKNIKYIFKKFFKKNVKLKPFSNIFTKTKNDRKVYKYIVIKKNIFNI